MTLDERMGFLLQSIESHDRQIGENAAQIAQLRDSIAKLAAVTNEDSTAIRALARIAESH